MCTSVASYAQVAKALGAPRSARAVGNAIGAKPGCVTDSLPPGYTAERYVWGLSLGAQQETYGTNMGKNA